MQLLGKEQGCNIGPFITASPPFPLPAFWGSGRILRRMRRFGSQELSQINLVAFLNDCRFPFLDPRGERLYS